LIEDVANELARYKTFAMLAPHSCSGLTHDSGMPDDNGIIRATYTISGFVKPDEILALRMVNCVSGEIAWAGDFTFSRDKILLCFGRLTRRIASSLAKGIENMLERESHVTGNVNAYGHYLNGQSAMQNCDLAGLRRARKHFKASIKEDEKFASASARIAQTLYQEWLMLGAEDAHILADSRQCADQSVERDPDNSVSRLMNAVISLYQRDFDIAERNFEQAEILAPNSSDVLVQYGDALSLLGRPEEGMEKFKRALDINPIPPKHYWWAGASIASACRDHQTAIDYCAKMPNDESVVRILASAHAWLGNKSEARHYAGRVKELYPDFKIENVSKYVPDRTGETTKIFIEGLRMAGIS
jgi:hypothetical protein